MSHLRERLNWLLTGVLVTVIAVIALGGFNSTVTAPNTALAQTGSSLNDLETVFTDLYANLNPSVVSIQVRQPLNRTVSNESPYFQFPGVARPLYTVSWREVRQRKIWADREVAVTMSCGVSTAHYPSGEGN